MARRCTVLWGPVYARTSRRRSRLVGSNRAPQGVTSRVHVPAPYGRAQNRCVPCHPVKPHVVTPECHPADLLEAVRHKKTGPRHDADKQAARGSDVETGDDDCHDGGRHNGRQSREQDGIYRLAIAGRDIILEVHPVCPRHTEERATPNRPHILGGFGQPPGP